MNRRLTTVIILLIVCCVGMTGCKDGFQPVTATVIKEDQYGDVMLDLEETAYLT